MNPDIGWLILTADIGLYKKRAENLGKSTLNYDDLGTCENRCLSDLYNISERLFGISITKISESNYNDEIEIFSDIKYRVNENSDLIELDDSNISKIVDKLDAYTEVKNTAIDIHFTRRIDENCLRKLSELLKNKNINVRKMFYISNMSTRFVFDRYCISSEYVCSYSIIDGKIGLIDVSGRIITHGNIFPLYVELLYPNKELTKEDLENIVWTVKKRTYRIDNFPALKLPETIKFFRSAKNSFCSRITGKLTFESPFII